MEFVKVIPQVPGASLPRSILRVSMVQADGSFMVPAEFADEVCARFAFAREGDEPKPVPPMAPTPEPVVEVEEPAAEEKSAPEPEAAQPDVSESVKRQRRR